MRYTLMGQSVPVNDALGGNAPARPDRCTHHRRECARMVAGSRRKLKHGRKPLPLRTGGPWSCAGWIASTDGDRRPAPVWHLNGTSSRP